MEHDRGIESASMELPECQSGSGWVSAVDVVVLPVCKHAHASPCHCVPRPLAQWRCCKSVEFFSCIPCRLRAVMEFLSANDLMMHRAHRDLSCPCETSSGGVCDTLTPFVCLCACVLGGGVGGCVWWWWGCLCLCGGGGGGCRCVHGPVTDHSTGLR